MKLKIKSLEMHCTHACNLNCTSCTHYSNHHHGGHVSVEDADEQMQHWNKRLNPDRFSILGGEPALHPNLSEFIKMTRKNWPVQNIGLTSNGLHLAKLHPNLPEVLKETNCNLTVNQHHTSPDYMLLYDEALKSIKEWSKKYKIPIRIQNATKFWRHQYFGYGSTMKPYQDESPRESWVKCNAKRCKTLFEGKIWKCPPLAYLKLQDAKFNLSSDWDLYLGYKPLDPSCSDQELTDFFAKEEEPYCAMCPSNPQHFLLPNPLKKNDGQNIKFTKDDPNKVHRGEFEVLKNETKMI